MHIESRRFLVGTAQLPLHPMLAPFPTACLLGALLTDLAYWYTTEIMWADFSAWLLAAGVALGAIALVIGVIEFLREPTFRYPWAAWVFLIGNAAAWLLASLNSFVHSRDAWTSVVPTGLTLSVITAVLLVLATICGWMLIYAPRQAEQWQMEEADVRVTE